jgi:hypothetical protein
LFPTIMLTMCGGTFLIGVAGGSLTAAAIFAIADDKPGKNEFFYYNKQTIVENLKDVKNGSLDLMKESALRRHSLLKGMTKARLELKKASDNLPQPGEVNGIGCTLA